MSNRERKKMVFIASPGGHNKGHHEHEKSIQLFKELLDQSPHGGQLTVECHTNSWPANDATLNDADLILFYTSGVDVFRNRQAGHPAYTKFTSGQFTTLERQMRRGCGLINIHFSTFVTNEEGERMLDWAGGYYDSDAGDRWYSNLATNSFHLNLSTMEHPIARGVAPSIAIHDEIYFKMRFRKGDKRIIPLWTVPEVRDDKQDLSDVVAWALEREDGGRGFVTTIGHAFSLWDNPDIRRLMLQAILWTAKVVT